MADVLLRDVRKRYGASQVVHGVSLELKHREFIVFVGPSGCKGITAMTLEHCRVPQTLLLSSLNNRVNVCFRVENLWAGEENGEEGKEWRSRVAFRVCETYSDEEDSYSDEARRVRAHLEDALDALVLRQAGDILVAEEHPA